MDKDMTEILKEYFSGKEEVLLAFLFGSAASGRLTGRSDVDLAILFGSMPEFPDVLSISDAVSKEMGRDVDIVVLNDSSPVIRMQVLRNGIVLKGRASATYGHFFVKTIKEYDDLKHIRKEAEENILKGRMYA